MAAALALFFAGCTFEPAVPGPPGRDAGRDITPRDGGSPDPDGGDRDGGAPDPDGGEIDGGERDAGVRDPRAPTIDLDDGTYFPYDSITLPSGTDPDGDPIDHEWTVTLPPSAVGGFGAYPGETLTSTEASPRLHLSIPGTYVIEVSVSDGQFTTRESATWIVVGFDTITIADPDEVETLTIDPRDGTLWIGTSGKGGRRYTPGAAQADDVPCTERAKTNAIALSTEGGLVAFGSDPGIMLFDGTSCFALSAMKTTTRGLVALPIGEDFLACGDPSVHLFDASQNRITDTFDFDVVGDGSKYRGAAYDGLGRFWFGLDEGVGGDGIVATPFPPNEEAPRIDLFAGDDKVKSIRRGVSGEIWIAADRGIAWIANTTTATSTLRTFVAGVDFDTAFNGHFRDSGVVPGGDVWFANQRGVARYKRAEDVFIVLGRGRFGLPGDADLRGAAAWRDRDGRRVVYVGGKPSLYVLRVPGFGP